MMSLKKMKFNFHFLTIFYSICLYFLMQFQASHAFPFLLVGYLFCFALYLLSCSRIETTRDLYLSFVSLAVICSLQLPYLSVDYFRFLWDGLLQHQNINPYDYKPIEAIHQLKVISCSTLDIYGGISQLSLNNYTCYPAVNQWYFYLSTWNASWSIETSLLLLRVFIFLTELAGLWFLIQLLKDLGISPLQSKWLYLNPLFLIESIANVHFEGVMVSFLIAAFYFLLRKKYVLLVICLALSIQIKLIPLLFLPFLLRYLSWPKTIWIGIGTFVGIVVPQLFYIDSSNFSHFMSSIGLYFREFEFNSLLLYPYLLHGIENFGWNMTRIYAPQLAQLFTFLALYLAFYGGTISYKQMLNRMLFASIMYLTFTSTVHPWYWILPLTLAVIAENKWVVFATLTTFLSYGLYYFDTKGVFRDLLWLAQVAWLLIFLQKTITKQHLRYYFPFFFSGTGS